jgi:DNA-binding SARP family transcriptional activator
VAGVIGADRQAAASLTSAGSRFAALDAPVLQCWAESLAALDSAARHGKGSLDRARTAAAAAARQRIRGAEAIGLVAVSLADPSDRAAAERADTVAGACGLRTAVLALIGSDRPAQSVPAAAPVPRPRTAAEDTAGAPPAQITCFGGLELRIGSQVVDFTSLRPRSRTLLRSLAMAAGQDVHRERLIDWLWPDAEITVATRRLQVAVSSVRQLLDQASLDATHGIVRHGDAYRLELPPGSRVDVRDFEALLRRASAAETREQALAARQEALGLYVGELFPEEGPAEFVVATRDRLRVAAAGAAAAAAQDAAAIGRAREALAAARLSVDLEPYQDLPWQLLADLHEAAGDISAAEQARRDHARARDELEGVS